MVAVTHVESLRGHRLRVRFDDGSERIVDLTDALWGEMGEPLRDPKFFRQVRVDPELRTVVWPNGFDLDPDVLHGDYEPVAPLDSRQVNENVEWPPSALTDSERRTLTSERSERGPKSSKFVIYADSNGHYRWKLVASNGQTTASSGESFASKANARQAAEGVKETSQTAEIVD
jgi:uncharacterized protein YegP (UPF0339 family)